MKLGGYGETAAFSQFAEIYYPNRTVGFTGNSRPMIIAHNRHIWPRLALAVHWRLARERLPANFIYPLREPDESG